MAIGLRKRWKRGHLILLVIGVGSFMSAVDNAATYLIAPIVARDLATTVVAAQWISLVFLLSVSALLLPFGRLGDLLGLRRVYVAGISIFGVASFSCAVAPTITYLIVFRALEGVGAAMIIAAAPALLTSSFPPQRRGHILGLQLMMTFLGLTVGPFLGGFVAGLWSWRGVFWINVLVSLFLLFLAWRAVPETRRSLHERFDFSGAALLMVSVFLVMLGITGTGEVEASSGPRTLLRPGLIVTGLLFGFVFVAKEKSLEKVGMHPLLSVMLFANRSFSLSATLSLIGYTCEFFVIFLMPFYLIHILGLPPAQAGLLFMAKSLVMMVVAPLSGDLSDRRGPRPLSVLSMLCFGGAFVLQSRLDDTAALPEVVLALALTGLASGLFVSPNNSAMIGAAPLEMRGVASAVIGLMRNFGMVLGTAFSGALLMLRPQSLLAGFHLGMEVGAVIAVAGLGLALLRVPEPISQSA